MTHTPKYLLATLLATASCNTHATVSEYGEFYIPYQRLQSEATCLNRQIMQAEYGIPLASMLQGVFSETRTLQQNLGGTSPYININLLVNGSTTIPHTYNFDRYTSSGVYDYSFTLDMGPFNTLNGNTVAGRQKTKDLAKLALISVIKTAEATHGTGHFRVWLKFDNLPSQSSLSGSMVHAGGTDWPTWPYTASSPLYQTYKTEMIAAECGN